MLRRLLGMETPNHRVAAARAAAAAAIRATRRATAAIERTEQDDDRMAKLIHDMKGAHQERIAREQ